MKGQTQVAATARGSRTTGTVKRGAAALVFLTLLFTGTHAVAKPPSVEEKYSEQYVRSHLVAAKTTPQQAEEAFGKPHKVNRNVSQRGATETWTYERVQEGAQGSARKTLGALRKLSIAGIANIPGVGTATQAENKVNAASDVAKSGNSGAGPASSLTITFRDGVLSSYSLD